MDDHEHHDHGRRADGHDPGSAHAPEDRRAAATRSAGRLRDHPAGRLLLGVVALVGVLTLVGLVVLWPSGDHDPGPGKQRPTVAATVVEARAAPCAEGSSQRCATVVATVDEGRDADRRVTIVLGPEGVAPSLEPGDAIRLSDQSPDPASGVPVEPGAEPVYAYSGVDRRIPLVALIAGFALLGLLVARGRGLLALLGTGASLALVVLWLVPSILDGHPPLLVAVVGALAVMFVTTALTYGVTAQSLAAVAGIGVSLSVAALLGGLWLGLSGLDGTDSELGSFALQSGEALPLQGILLAGMVIGALGVLTDTVVSQVSTVAALHRTAPHLGARELYREAFVVGRDHLAATIHTLVLAYAGATLPLLLVASANDVTFLDAVNDTTLAEPIVSTLVGSIALLLSVPLSTLLAAILVGRLPAAALGDGHAHHHH